MNAESPFRYPGGKTWLVPRIVQLVSCLPRKPRIFLEPFAGGASVGLAIAEADLATKTILVEKDKNVASVWKTILGRDAEWLAQRIVQFELTRNNVEKILFSSTRSQRDRAFRTLLRNRVSRGGVISTSGGILKNGERGNGLASRWYPITLANRIRSIKLISDRIEFIQGDGLESLRAIERRPSSVIFVDPPYTSDGNGAGHRLYDESDLDHEELFRLCSRLCGVAVLTYDSNPLIRALARRHGFGVKKVLMRSTHHRSQYELLISNVRT